MLPKNNIDNNILQLNLSTTATLGTKESGRCGEVAVMGRYGCNMTLFFFREVQHVHCAKFMLTVAYNGNPILKIIYIDKIHNKT